jgi:hypothetical protein
LIEDTTITTTNNSASGSLKLAAQVSASPMDCDDGAAKLGEVDSVAKGGEDTLN